MSMPKFPTTENTPSREEAINQILSSIAMEELGLSHIINAEGEKLQYVLGTLEGTTGPENVTVEDVLSVNASVQSMLETTAYNQMFLKGKMSDALNAATLQGPTGATGLIGPQGTAAVQPFILGTGYAAGDLVEENGEIYIVNVDDPTGDPATSADYTLLSTIGPTGATGTISAGDALFNVVDPEGDIIPVAYADDLTFVTNTPETVTLTATAGAAGAIVEIDVLSGLLPGPTGSLLTVDATGAGITYMDAPVNSVVTIDGSGQAVAVTGATGTYLGFDPTTGGVTAMEAPGEDMVFFNAGPVNWTMPTTWPFIIDGVDLTALGAELQPVSQFLQTILGVATDVTSPLYAVLSPLATLVDTSLSALNLAYIPNLTTLLAMLTQFGTVANTPDVTLSMNSFIGLSNVGTEIQLGTEELNIWGGLVAGPPYPIVMPRAGQITTFQADFDALAALNPQQLLDLIPGLSDLLSAVTDVLGVVSGFVDSLDVLTSTALNALLTPLGLSTSTLPSVPSLTTDLTTTGFADGDTVEIVATLWQIPSIMTSDVGNVNMTPNGTTFEAGASVELQGVQGTPISPVAIAQINLGEIELAHLAAWDATTSLPGEGLNALTTALGLSGAAASTNTEESGEFASALAVLPAPVQVNMGDELMVEFSILSPDGAAIAVGIAAPNLSASVTYI